MRFSVKEVDKIFKKLGPISIDDAWAALAHDIAVDAGGMDAQQLLMTVSAYPKLVENLVAIFPPERLFEDIRAFTSQRAGIRTPRTDPDDDVPKSILDREESLRFMASWVAHIIALRAVSALNARLAALSGNA